MRFSVFGGCKVLSVLRASISVNCGTECCLPQDQPAFSLTLYLTVVYAQIYSFISRSAHKDTKRSGVTLLKLRTSSVNFGICTERTHLEDTYFKTPFIIKLIFFILLENVYYILLSGLKAVTLQKPIEISDPQCQGNLNVLKLT